MIDFIFRSRIINRIALNPKAIRFATSGTLLRAIVGLSMGIIGFNIRLIAMPIIAQIIKAYIVYRPCSECTCLKVFEFGIK